MLYLIKKKIIKPISLTILIFLSIPFSLVFSATLSLSPDSGTFTVGDTFNVEIILDTEGQNTDGVDIHYLHFSASLLQAITTTPGTLYQNTLVNSIDNEKGLFEFSQTSQGGTFFNGTGTVVTISFQAIAEGMSTLGLDFTYGSTTDTNVASGGGDVLTSVSEAQFVVQAIPQTCPDGTLYGKCSSNKPKYCQDGSLVDKCSLCGCPQDYVCQEDGTCEKLPSTCPDGTLYGKCSSIKPKYCQDGTLVNKCSICGCPSGYSCQGDGSCIIVSQGGGGGGTPPPDITPPTIFNLEVGDITTSSAKIVWKTNEYATTKLYYGTTTQYKIGEISKTGYSKTHSIELFDLTASTTYYFKLVSADSNGNKSEKKGSFTTLAQPLVPDLTKPTVPTEPVVSSTTTPSTTTPPTMIPEQKKKLIAELKAKIQAILRQIAILQAKLAELLAKKEKFSFKRNLKYGDRGEDVKRLQEILIKEKCLGKNLNTGYFGKFTFQAVKCFQKKYASEVLSPLGIKEATGFVGKMTRKKLNQLLSR